jgi:hypothetical protein
MSPTNESPLVIEFHGSRARFQSPAHENRVKQVMRQADSLAEKAVVDRDRLKVRARL